MFYRTHSAGNRSWQHARCGNSPLFLVLKRWPDSVGFCGFWLFIKDTLQGSRNSREDTAGRGRAARSPPLHRSSLQLPRRRAAAGGTGPRPAPGTHRAPRAEAAAGRSRAPRGATASARGRARAARPSAPQHGPSWRCFRCRHRCPAPGYPCRGERRAAPPPSTGLHRSAARPGPYGPD